MKRSYRYLLSVATLVILAIAFNFTIDTDPAASAGRGAIADAAVANDQREPLPRHGSPEDACLPNSRSARESGSGKAGFAISRTGIAASIWDDGTVSMAIPLENESARIAPDATVTDIFVSAGTRLEPASLPIPLGDMAPEEIRVVGARYRLQEVGTRARYRLIVAGRYTMRGRPCSFKVGAFVRPQALDDTVPISSKVGVMHKQDPLTADFPPGPPPVEERPNAESPILIPAGPPRQLFPPTPTPIHTDAAGAVEVFRNTSMLRAGFPPDPSTARGTSDVVVASYNTGVSYSIDGGVSFTDVNLTSPEPGNPSRTSFFPQSDGGVCCDQVVIYVPGWNLFVWLLQYQPVVVTNTATTPPTGTITQPNRLRIAWASPERIRADFWNAWTYGDLTGNRVSGVSDGLGTASNEWLDYPDLAYSDNFLYVSVDHGFPAPGAVYGGQRIVARLSLEDMADPSATVVNYGYSLLTGTSGLNKSHFVQHAPGRMVIAGLVDTSTLRIYTWEDDEGAIASWTMPITSITNSYTSVAPDGTDWYAVSFPGNITGGAYNVGTGEYLIAFDGGRDPINGRPNGYVRIESMIPFLHPFIPPLFAAYVATSEHDLWSPSFAVAMGVLGAQGAEIGFGITVGGGTVGYPQYAVGFKGDAGVLVVTSSNATQTNAMGGSRFGDYFSVRPVPGTGVFATETYDVLQMVPMQTCRMSGCRAVMRYVEFGRPGPF